MDAARLPTPPAFRRRLPSDAAGLPTVRDSRRIQGHAVPGWLRELDPGPD